MGSSPHLSARSADTPALHQINGAAAKRNACPRIVSKKAYDAMLTELKQAKEELIAARGSAAGLERDLQLYLSKLFRRHSISVDLPGFNDLVEQLLRETMAKPASDSDCLENYLMGDNPAGTFILQVFEKGRFFDAEKTPPAPQKSAIAGLAREIREALRGVIQKLSDPVKSGLPAPPLPQQRMMWAGPKDLHKRHAWRTEQRKKIQEADQILTEFTDALVPPPQWKIVGVEPTHPEERKKWRCEQRKKTQEADQKRTEFAGALVATMLERIQSDSRMEDAAQWNIAEIRSLVIQAAIHGAIEHLCTSFVLQRVPAALTQAIEEKIQQDEEETEKEMHDLEYGEMAAAEKKKKRKARGDVDALEQRVTDMKETVNTSLAKSLSSSDKNLQSTISFAELLARVRHNMTERVREILEDVRHGKDGREILHMIREDFALTFATMCDVLPLIAAKSL